MDGSKENSLTNTTGVGVRDIGATDRYKLISYLVISTPSDILKACFVRVSKLLGRLLARSLEKRKKLDCYCTSNELLQRHLPKL